jgi:hypothetical protein
MKHGKIETRPGTKKWKQLVGKGFFMYDLNRVFSIYKGKSNKMQKYIKILLLHIYMKLSMFRATHRPSTGA